MGFSGLIGAGAGEGLEDLLARQLLQQQQAERERAQRAQEALAGQRLAQDASQHTDVMGLRGRELDQRDTARRDDANRAGVADMLAQRELMDKEGASAALARELEALLGDPAIPGNVKNAARFKRVGATVNPDDLRSPEQIAAEDQRKVSQIGAEAEARARAEAKYRQPSGGSTEQAWVIRDGKPVPIPKGSAQPGDTPYDPVAARTAQPANTPEAVDTAREVQRIAGELSKHPGFSGAFGLGDALNPFTLKQSTADAEVLRDTLSSLLTLENMGKMKGVLSDSDMKLLQRASTTINARMSEPAARKELRRLGEIMSRVTGEGGGAPAPVSSHGGTVKMQAPTGEIRDIPAAQVEHFKAQGAKVVGGA